MALALVSTLPSMIKEVELKYKINSTDTLNNKASGIFNFVYCTGTLLGPLIGGILHDYFRK